MVALGNFDGVHRGHQAVLAGAAQMAERLNAPMAALVFSPHPRLFFRPEDPPFQLMSESGRADALAEQGVQWVFEAPFNAALSQMEAEAFVQTVLVEGLGVRGVAAGFNYHFGKDRGGNAAVLAELAARHGFAVEVSAAEAVAGVRCSSSAIRTALQDGDLTMAEGMLTRPWAIDGVVAQGDQRGRLLGFPTANVPLGDFVRPRFGVYAVEVQMEAGGPWRAGVANIGKRPTVGGTQERVEAHIFDFAADLYGRCVAVRLRAFIRDEEKFDGLEALKAQIALDAAQARALLAGV